jgi:[acyl-carrier-protein] S-malonyltransferase
LQSRGADPRIRTEDYDPYLDPGKKLPVEVAIEDEAIREKLLALEKKYASVPKVREPHPDIGCWWTLYDYGQETIAKWPKDYKHPYPGARPHLRDLKFRWFSFSSMPLPKPCWATLAEEIRRKKDEEDRKKQKAERRKRREAATAAAKNGGVIEEIDDTPDGLNTPMAFLFPGQGSQAIGMLKVRRPAIQFPTGKVEGCRACRNARQVWYL